MYFFFDNKNIHVDRSKLHCSKGHYGKHKYAKEFIVPEYQRNEKGRIIPFKVGEDALEQLLETVKSGDTVIIPTVLCLSTKTERIIIILMTLMERGVRIIALTEDFDSQMLDMSTFAIISRVAMSVTKEQRKAQRQGIQLAREGGRYSRGLSTSDFENFPKLYEMLQNDDITKIEFAKELGVSRPTLDKLLREYKDAL